MTHLVYVEDFLHNNEEVEAFVRLWRSHFLEKMKPRFLPDGWRVDYPVFLDKDKHKKFNDRLQERAKVREKRQEENKEKLERLVGGNKGKEKENKRGDLKDGDAIEEDEEEEIEEVSDEEAAAVLRDPSLQGVSFSVSH